MCRVRNFCCCCRLRTGAIFTALFTLTYAAGLIVGGALLLDHRSRWYYSSSRSYEVTSIWCQLVSGILSLIAFICLVVAIWKHRPGCALVWLIVAFLDIALQIVIVIVSVFAEQWYNLGVLLFSLWFIYLWVIVYSYYKLLTERYFPATSSKGDWQNGRV